MSVDPELRRTRLQSTKNPDLIHLKSRYLSNETLSEITMKKNCLNSTQFSDRFQYQHSIEKLQRKIKIGFMETSNILSSNTHYDQKMNNVFTFIKKKKIKNIDSKKRLENTIEKGLPMTTQKEKTSFSPFQI